MIISEEILSLTNIQIIVLILLFYLLYNTYNGIKHGPGKSVSLIKCYKK